MRNVSNDRLKTNGGLTKRCDQGLDLDVSCPESYVRVNIRRLLRDIRANQEWIDKQSKDVRKSIYCTTRMISEE
jgi:hypothetical protein